MNALIQGFKACAHQAGEICRLGPRTLIRDFGLSDFLENKISEDDTADDIAVKAIEFFCEERDPPYNKCFKFGVLTIGIFLNYHRADIPMDSVLQPVRDLVSILAKSGTNEQQWRQWIDSQF
jgi:hypothetical protein